MHEDTSSTRTQLCFLVRSGQNKQSTIIEGMENEEYVRAQFVLCFSAYYVYGCRIAEPPDLDSAGKDGVHAKGDTERPECCTPGRSREANGSS